MNKPSRSNVPNVIACGIGLLVGISLASLALLLSSLANMTGHGSALPEKMLAAPWGLGLLVWPLGYASLGVTRRLLPGALLLLIALSVAHGASAWHVYNSDALGRSRLVEILNAGMYQAELKCLLALVVMAELTAPICLVIRIVFFRLKE